MSMTEAGFRCVRALSHNSSVLMPIRSLLLAGGGLFLLSVILIATAPSPSVGDDGVQVPPDTTKPLRPLMVGLAQDMDRISTGLWYEDYDWIEQGARGIAQHPKIPPKQIAKIKKTLGEQFGTFVQYDKSVHQRASELVTAAEARDWSAVLDTHRELQRGCMGCHTAFREQLRPVLTE